MEKLTQFLYRHRLDIIRAAAALGANLVIMLLLPAVIISNSSSAAGMMICITMFFAVDPIFSFAAGLYAGLDIKNRWFTAAFPPLTFLLSARIVFGADASDFSVYAVVYTAIALPAMLFTFLVKKYSRSSG